MNKKRRKLTLSTETLRTLDEPSLKEVAAGVSIADTVCTRACSACTVGCSICCP